MTDKGFQIKGWHLLVIAIAAFLVFSGYITIPNINWGDTPAQQYVCPIDGQVFPTWAAYNSHYQSAHGTTPPTTPPVTPGSRSAQIQFDIYDYIAQSTTTAANGVAEFTQAVNGVFDFATTAASPTVNSGPEQTGQYFVEGAEVIAHVSDTGDPTSGNEYYDMWYYFKINSGAPVYVLSYSMLQQVSGAPHFTYRVSTAGAATTGYTITFTSGTTNYWDIGITYIWPRIAITDFDLTALYQSVAKSSLSDGATWVDTGQETTANLTMTSTSGDLYLDVYMQTASLGFGKTELVLTSQFEIVEYKPVCIVAFNCTGFSSSKLEEQSFVPISDSSLTTGKAYYKVLDPQFPEKGLKKDFRITIPLDSSAVVNATCFRISMWIMDMQRISNVVTGSPSTVIPTVYGFVTDYSPDDICLGRAYTTSSGLPATPQIIVDGQVAIP